MLIKHLAGCPIVRFYFAVVVAPSYHYYAYLSTGKLKTATAVLKLFCLNSIPWTSGSIIDSSVPDAFRFFQINWQDQSLQIL